MINVTAFAFTGYPVTDIPKSRAFYEGVLGLKPATVFEHDGKFWIEYELGESTLAINNISPEWKPSSDGPIVTCEVADFDAAVAHLRQANVRFLIEPRDTGPCHLAVVLDPSGNSLAIHRRKKTN
jgi:catechol 2,3-dioxygenase-like lactoylglutathione lyase family enzyme